MGGGGSGHCPKMPGAIQQMAKKYIQLDLEYIIYLEAIFLKYTNVTTST